MTVRLGGAFQPTAPPPPPPETERTLNAILAALNDLHTATAAQPAPQVTVEQQEFPVERIIEAVNSLRPGAGPDDIAAEILRLMPQPDTSPTQELSATLAVLTKKLETLDFRMQGGPAFGSSGPSNIASDPAREMGLVTVKNTGVVADIKTVLENIRDGGTSAESRLDYDTRTDGNPVYVGSATNGTATSAAAWSILKLTYDSSARLTRKQVLANQVWDNRASLAW